MTRSRRALAYFNLVNAVVSFIFHGATSSLASKLAPATSFLTLQFRLNSLALAAVAILIEIGPGDCGTVNLTPPAEINWIEGQAFSKKHWTQISPHKGEEIVQALTLYGTYYYMPTLPYSLFGIAIKDIAGNLLGPRLAKNEFCNAGIEGTFRSAPSANGRPQTYNIERGPSEAAGETDCTSVYANVLEEHKQGKRIENWPAFVSSFERARYRATDAPYGNGGSNRWLIPWRSIATYNLQIPPGTIIYIPKIDGLEVELPSGERVQHDGYFFAADSGAAIKENHIDFFTGLLSPANRPPLLTGIDGDKSPFVAQVVNRNDATLLARRMTVSPEYSGSGVAFVSANNASRRPSISVVMAIVLHRANNLKGYWFSI